MGQSDFFAYHSLDEIYAFMDNLTASSTYITMDTIDDGTFLGKPMRKYTASKGGSKWTQVIRVIFTRENG